MLIFKLVMRIKRNIEVKILADSKYQIVFVSLFPLVLFDHIAEAPTFSPIKNVL